jgi:transcriptional regulator with PAS, ATPase and Fis domain
LGRVDERGRPEVIRSCGVNPDAAALLIRAVASNGASPFISTNVQEILPDLRGSSRLRSLLGVSVGSDESRGLCLVCWETDEKTYGAHRSEPSQMLEAYYEISRLVPVFEKGLWHDRGGIRPVCFGGMLTADRRLKEILLSLPRIAATRANVLVVGETGTGKELVARAVHALSPRRAHPFVAQNCAAIPEQLLESELFGHRAGAFTDARADKRGLFETAGSGTFFLDEIGDVCPSIQAKMLRAIENREIRRLGDTMTRPIDVRFISASNKDLEAEVEKGRFRRDLYYRLNVVSLALPPLRERKDDIVLLARLFLWRFASKTAGRTIEIEDGAVRALVGYSWPGNVRQLENEIERAVTMLGSGGVVAADMLTPCVTGGAVGNYAASLKDEVRAVERSRILAVLEKCGWNKSHAARMLGDISRPALIAKMKRLGIPLMNPQRRLTSLSPPGG